MRPLEFHSMHWLLKAYLLAWHQCLQQYQPLYLQPDFHRDWGLPSKWNSAHELQNPFFGLKMKAIWMKQRPVNCKRTIRSTNNHLQCSPLHSWTDRKKKANLYVYSVSIQHIYILHYVKGVSYYEFVFYSFLLLLISRLICLAWVNKRSHSTNSPKKWKENMKTVKTQTGHNLIKELLISPENW